MKLGYLYNKTEEEVKKDISKGVEVYQGIEINSLLNSINICEALFENDPNKVLAELKKQILIYQGKIEVQNEEDPKKN
jgi:hypothetical protein